MGEFLENLKKAADTGEFNSEAAKKILEINELADKKLGNGTIEDLERLKEKLTKRVVEPEKAKSTPAEPTGKIADVPEEPEETKNVEAVPKPIDEEEVQELNSEYEKKMANLKLIDAVNAQLAMLIEIEDMVVLTIGDMFGHITEIETNFKSEFEAENPMFGDLYQKIEEIKAKYKSI